MPPSVQLLTAVALLPGLALMTMSAFVMYKLSVPRLSRGPSGPRLADELEALARREACGPSPRRLLISFSTPGRSRHLHRR
jgi:hypothetical protein